MKYSLGTAASEGLFRTDWNGGLLIYGVEKIENVVILSSDYRGVVEYFRIRRESVELKEQ